MKRSFQMTLTLKSNDFTANGLIPSEFTCDGDNISPTLSWQGAPSSTKSFVLIMDDPDAPGGVWDHWLLFNIPAALHELSAGVISPPDDSEMGMNSWGETGYGGPCPPDREHRYFFKLYALDTKLNLSSPKKSQLEAAMNGHIIEKAVLIGRYNRNKK
jgi:Raf kinase inhibitor-like YbhB/YbcL family protein